MQVGPLPLPNQSSHPDTCTMCTQHTHTHTQQLVKAMHHVTRPMPGIHVVLVDQNPLAFYSGMMPGCVAQLYTAAQTHIQLTPLAKWASVEFVQARVTAINAGT